MSNAKTILMLSAVVMFVAAPAMAVPVDVYSENGPQDHLFLEGDVHECGDFFPDGERISSEWWETYETACPEFPHDDPEIPNVMVQIFNEDCCDSCPLWYVADPLTSITNYDGWIGNAGMGDATLAFKIDHVGVNQPLVYESMTWDNLFEPGETWWFIIQDFMNPFGGPPAPFDSIGIAGNSLLWPPSTGSIITPEPGTACLLILGGIGVLIRRHRA